MLLLPLLLVMVRVKGYKSGTKEIATDKEIMLNSVREVTPEAENLQSRVHLVFPSHHGAHHPPNAVTSSKNEDPREEGVSRLVGGEKEILFPARQRRPNTSPPVKQHLLFTKSNKKFDKTQEWKFSRSPNFLPYNFAVH